MLFAVFTRTTTVAKQQQQKNMVMKNFKELLGTYIK